MKYKQNERHFSTDKPEKKINVLAVCTDNDTIDCVSLSLDRARYNVSFIDNESEVLARLKDEAVDVLILDVEIAPCENIDIVSFIRSTVSKVKILVLAPPQRIREATNAIRHGVSLFLVKPVEPEDIRVVISRLSGDLVRSAERKDFEYRTVVDLMGGCDSMRRILHLAGKIAPTTSTVLISGETGTGKELLARIIHRLSNRDDERFVPVNCGAIPETLFESELFGHRKGSFTGADRDKVGLVESAHQGTLFLDEIGELTPQSQVKLLRFLQERTFRRIGDTVSQRVNVRIIAATNRDLTKMVEEGTFREDLFYRLCVFHLHMPPLRERKETIPNLVRFFMHRFNQSCDRNIFRISPGVERALMSYSYPGNVRELENIIERAFALVEGEELTEQELPESLVPEPLLLKGPLYSISSNDGFPTLQAIERRHIEEALRIAENNYGRAAEALGVCRATLWRKLKQYGINRN
ncbi:MAG: sigma-54-dependent Fis family transcriptional regulator [Candidatus Latescibacteria bacterium]|nr:sigma-54-dependent Fis family transcriptional regulator [Candidatus Latescibacterota bacterium]